MGMNTNLPLYRIVINENTEQGLDFISLVDEPAIIEKGLYFAKHQVFVRPNAGESENDFISRCIPVVIEEGKDQDQAAAICYSYWEDKDTFDSITDYPQGIKDTAQRALNYVEENGWGTCGTPVGKQRANQLAKGEAISEDTIKRMYSFLSRHKGGGAGEGEYGDGCGKLMYDAWGGDAALSWSERYLNSLQFKLNKFEFKKTKDKQIVVGPAMIPDLPIYRFDKEMGEYNVVFDAETIDKLVEKFAKTNKEYKINVDHDSIVPSAFIKSSWIIEDEDNDKSKVYGFSLPKGTWMVEIKVEDEEFWNKEVKNNEKFGMSVEGLFELELVNNNKLNKKEKMKLEDLKLALAELTPEEVAELTAAIAEVAPTEVVDEVTQAVVQTVNDLMPEEEDVEEDVEEMAEDEKEQMTVETYTKEEVDVKFEELMAAIAEVKSMMESAPEEEANANEFSLQDNRLSFLKMYRSKL